MKHIINFITNLFKRTKIQTEEEDNVFFQKDTHKHKNSNAYHYWIRCVKDNNVFYIRLSEYLYKTAIIRAERNKEDKPKLY